MESKQVKIKIKHGADQCLEILIQTEWTVLQLKEEIAKVQSCQPTDIKLIFKGKILKDVDSLNQLKVEEGSTMHMVVAKPNTQQPKVDNSSSQPQSSSQSQSQPAQQQVPNNMNTGLGQNPFMGLGGLGAFPGMGMGMGMGVPPNFQQMLSDPQAQQMMQQIFQNPQIIQNMMQQNPMMRQLVEQHPEMQQMLSDPQMLQQMGQIMQNPQMLNQIMQQFSGLGANQFGAFQPPQQPQQQATSSATSEQQPQQNQQPNPQPQTQNNQNASQPDIQQLMNMLSGNPLLGGLGGLNFGGNFGAQNFGANQQNNDPPEVRYKTQLETLEGMGFTNKTVNLQALQATNGNVEAAVERILNMCGDKL